MTRDNDVKDTALPELENAEVDTAIADASADMAQALGEIVERAVLSALEENPLDAAEVDPILAQRRQALAAHLGLEGTDDVDDEDGETRFSYGRAEYLVLSDEEVDAAAREAIEQSVWAFNASFLRAHLRKGIDESVITLLQSKCEGANDAITAMIEDFDHFIDDAIKADGRGHFLAGYDGEENEQETTDADGKRTMWFIYRLD